MARCYLFVFGLIFSCLLFAEEGMWLYSDPPTASLQEQYGFTPSSEWLLHLQRASVRFNNGGSGSFVSKQGLVMTNHHVGIDCLQKLSTQAHNYVQNGFLAKTHQQEMQCVDLELNVLMDINDVTVQVNGVVTPHMTLEEAFLARRSVIAAIEKDSLAQTGLRSNVVTLFQGGQYHLYRYKRYTDVRLVWAPEQQAAAFGGEPDNFEFPRYDLDAAFFRVYENGHPLHVQDYLKWSKNGAQNDELVFVSGHPGHTSRLLTLAELRYKRDEQYPRFLDVLRREEVLLTNYSAISTENARVAKDTLLSTKNSRKALTGGMEALLTPSLMEAKQQEEEALQAAMRADARFAEDVEAFDQIARAQREIGRIALDYNLLERGLAFNTQLFTLARQLVRHSVEAAKPNGERLQEYTDSNKASFELQLFSPEPITDDLEVEKLADSLTLLANKRGADDRLVQAVLAGISPRERAVSLVKNTRLKDIKVRRQLYASDAKTLAASLDPMIQLALLVDQESRELGKMMDAAGESKQQAYAKLARARFVLQQGSAYPDATFTLRLAYGQVKGYEADGKVVNSMTTLGGMYAHSKAHDDMPPYNLPASWVAAKKRLNLATPYNFVSTVDIIGGNSGSPVVNKNGEVVGLIFDGNKESLSWDFAYSDRVGRAVSVHSAGILEALQNVYGASRLANELKGL